MRSLVTLLVFFCVSCAAAEDGFPSKLALGVNYTGAQARCGLTPRTALEARYQSGESGDVSASAVGLRLYRFLREAGRYRAFFGGELAALSGDTKDRRYGTSGFAAGAFFGIETRPVRSIAIGLDAGPYFIALKERKSKLSSSGLDFVLDTYAVFYLF